jgi:hypothetical protein
MKPAVLLVLAILFTRSGFTQVSKQRLIAQSGYSSDVSIPNSWYIQDSAFLVYSGNRQSHFDYNTMQYFDLTANVISGMHGFVAPNNIDSIGNSLHVSFDTLYYFNRDNSTGDLKVHDINALRFFGDGRCAGTFSKTNIDDRYSYFRTEHRQFLYIYDRLIQETQFTAESNAGIADTFYHRKRFFNYDAFGNCVIDSLERAAIFEYDGQGRYTSRRYSTWYLFEFTYYPDGKVKTMLYSEPDSGIYGSKILDSFGYTLGIPGFTSRVSSWVDYPNTVSSFRNITFHVNALGQKDTMFITDPWWPGYYEQAYFVYNKQGNPEYKVYEHGIGASVSQRTKTVYYYQDFVPNLSIKPVSPASWQIFPNPSTGTFKIQPPPNSQNHIIQIFITDMLGRQVQTQSFICTTSPNEISIPYITPPGIYTIVIRDNTANTVDRTRLQKL